MTAFLDAAERLMMRHFRDLTGLHLAAVYALMAALGVAVVRYLPPAGVAIAVLLLTSCVALAITVAVRAWLQGRL